eukprot:2049571-Amphidinium_carterae.2
MQQPSDTDMPEDFGDISEEELPRRARALPVPGTLAEAEGEGLHDTDEVPKASMHFGFLNGPNDVDTAVTARGLSVKTCRQSSYQQVTRDAHCRPPRVRQAYGQHDERVRVTQRDAGPEYCEWGFI